MRILVTGDRHWSDKTYIKDVVESLHKIGQIDCIIEGEAKGADTLAREVCEELGIEVAKYPANWERYGRAAGPVRNGQMLLEGRPDLILAFHDDIYHSLGTKNMIFQALGHCVKVRIHSHKESTKEFRDRFAFHKYLQELGKQIINPS